MNIPNIHERDALAALKLSTVVALVLLVLRVLHMLFFAQIPEVDVQGVVRPSLSDLEKRSLNEQSTEGLNEQDLMLKQSIFRTRRKTLETVRVDPAVQPEPPLESVASPKLVPASEYLKSVETQRQKKVASCPWRLRGIVWGEQGRPPLVIIQHKDGGKRKFVRQGDRLDGWLVKTVRKYSVLMMSTTQDDVFETLSLK